MQDTHPDTDVVRAEQSDEADLFMQSPEQLELRLPADCRWQRAQAEQQKVYQPWLREHGEKAQPTRGLQPRSREKDNVEDGHDERSGTEDEGSFRTGE